MEFNMKKNISLKWKQQHLNSSCASACVAILLSNFDIDKEDIDVIIESKMPYLLEYDFDSNTLRAGVMMQEDWVFNNMLINYNLELCSEQIQSKNFALSTIDKLLNNNAAFMIGLPTFFLPPNAYNISTNINDNNKKHAIVVYKKENNNFFIYDPDGGINRLINNTFDNVKDHVSYVLSDKKLNDALDYRQSNIIIGYIQKNTNTINKIRCRHPNIPEAIIKYQDAVSLFFNDFANTEITKDTFMTFIMSFIKPLAMDLRSALEVIKQKNIYQIELIKSLNNLQSIALAFQRKFHDNKIDLNDKLAFSTRFQSLNDSIINLMKIHFSKS